LQDYPDLPPKVLIRTTGGGSVRFNPNLYAEGKVCLSLLGTWQGRQGESWDRQFSTALQVLVSIQSLILVDEPYYNEPGYEQHQDHHKSDAYSASVAVDTLRWAVLDQLKSPPKCLEAAIQQHFRLRGLAVLQSAQQWAEWCKSKGHTAEAAAISQMIPRLEEELQKLG
jgi:baculoviral IAP repeat-containing protein 6 (apollon)